jgi:hypothetical protein
MTYEPPVQGGKARLHTHLFKPRSCSVVNMVHLTATALSLVQYIVTAYNLPASTDLIVAEVVMVQGLTLLLLSLPGLLNHNPVLIGFQGL